MLLAALQMCFTSCPVDLALSFKPDSMERFEILLLPGGCEEWSWQLGTGMTSGNWYDIRAWSVVMSSAPCAGAAPGAEASVSTLGWKSLLC